MLRQAAAVKEARNAVPTVPSSTADRAPVNSTTDSPSTKPVGTCEPSPNSELEEAKSDEVFSSSPVSELLTAESETLKSSRKWSLSQRYFEYLNYQANFPKLISSDRTKLKAKIEEIFGFKDFKDIGGRALRTLKSRFS